LKQNVYASYQQSFRTILRYYVLRSSITQLEAGRLPKTNYLSGSGKAISLIVVLIVGLLVFYFFDMVICCWRFITTNERTLVAPGLSFVQFLGSFSLGLFCVLVVFPVAHPCTVRLVRRLQYQFTRSW